LTETQGIRISRLRGGRGCRCRSGGSRKSRAVLGTAARCAETSMACSERAWLKPLPRLIYCIAGGVKTGDSSCDPQREKSETGTRWRQTSRSLRTGYEMARALEGFGQCVLRQVYEERLKPEAPGKQPCSLGRLVEYQMEPLRSNLPWDNAQVYGVADRV
jgi:hypothetical protein